MNPFLGVRSEALKEALAAEAYHCYLLLVSSILDMVREIPPLLKYPRTLRKAEDNGQGSGNAS